MSSTNLVNKNLKRFSEKGLSLLEALISTAIVGIGFMAVFQLVNFSVNSVKDFLPKFLNLSISDSSFDTNSPIV